MQLWHSKIQREIQVKDFLQIHLKSLKSKVCLGGNKNEINLSLVFPWES